MHGSLLHSFKQFVATRDGERGWAAVVHRAGGADWYVSTRVYPDQEFSALVKAAAAHWNRPASDVLEDFGTALVPSLLKLYGSFVEPGWRTLALLMNAESVIHRTVRMRDPTAEPPLLRIRRVSDHEVEITYTSKRRLCALAVGICRGVAAHYGERVRIEQRSCMETGADACQILISLLPG